MFVLDYYIYALSISTLHYVYTLKAYVYCCILVLILYIIIVWILLREP